MSIEKQETKQSVKNQMHDTNTSSTKFNTSQFLSFMKQLNFKTEIGIE